MAPSPSVSSAEPGEAGCSECPTCGAPRPDEFCGRCGEKRVDEHDYSLRAFLRHAVEHIGELDFAVFRTIATLFRHPGLLTTEYFDGRRRPYMKPLQLFITINVVFFLLASHTNLLGYGLDHYVNGSSLRATTQHMVQAKLAARHITYAQYRVRFDDVLWNQKKSMMLTMIPLMALALAILHVAQRRYFVEHLTYAIHFVAWFLLFLIAYVLVVGTATAIVRGVSPAAARSLLWLQYDNGITLVVGIAIPIYLTLAARRFYRLRWPWAVAHAVAATLAFMFIVSTAYQEALFFTTYWMT
jgi:hypothetical protein